MNTYVVCMDSSWVRDSQMFDIVGLTDDELAEVDMCGTENERRWHDSIYRSHKSGKRGGSL